MTFIGKKGTIISYDPQVRGIFFYEFPYILVNYLGPTTKGSPA